MRDRAAKDLLNVLLCMARKGLPYHPAVLRVSLAAQPEVAEQIRSYAGAVFTNTGHWGTLALERESASNWILNQCDADIQFWQAYAAQARNPLVRWAARANFRLARRHFPSIYQRVAHIIAVSEEDRALTLPYAGGTPVDVILNGIDAKVYQPDRSLRAEGDGAQLLFTGTSAGRNVTALHDFLGHIFPQIQAAHPAARLCVAGNFSAAAQKAFRSYTGVEFTGRVPDMAPYFDRADVFVAPFRDAHGSKLKVAEAMAMALPVVATEAGVRGFPVVHGESALVAKDNAEFAAHVAWLIDHPAERARIGANARAVALNHLDWEMLGARALAIIASVERTLVPEPSYPAAEAQREAGIPG